MILTTVNTVTYEVSSASTSPNIFFNLYLKTDKIVVGGDVGEIKEKDIELVKKHLLKNKNTYLKFWNEEIDDDELKQLIRGTRWSQPSSK